jgi:hypothetical protein
MKTPYLPGRKPNLLARVLGIFARIAAVFFSL